MKNTKRLVWYISLAITVCAVAYLGLKAKEIGRIIGRLDEQILRAEEQQAKEETYLEELRIERENMDTLEYIEKVAREKLGMVKKDDIVFKEK
ncbi:MAG: FtsB family cell division protein [Cellulosilyticaceae bacterium]